MSDFVWVANYPVDLPPVPPVAFDVGIGRRIRRTPGPFRVRGWSDLKDATVSFSDYVKMSSTFDGCVKLGVNNLCLISFVRTWLAYIMHLRTFDTVFMVVV